jgi:multidrug efflux pump subunit AcrA (membrane-fusion protein)
VDVLVTGSAEELRPGMTAQCRIIVSRLADVVSVPLEAVFEREGQSVVFVVPGSGKPVPVTVGARSDDFVEIVTGLTGGEAVALSDPEKPAPAAPREEAKP